MNSSDKEIVIPLLCGAMVGGAVGFVLADMCRARRRATWAAIEVGSKMSYDAGYTDGQNQRGEGQGPTKKDGEENSEEGDAQEAGAQEGHAQETDGQEADAADIRTTHV